MIKLYTPEDDVQLAMLKGIFESESIHFFVLNDNFGSMRPGLRIALYNKKTIMVHKQDHARAQELLRDFLVNIECVEEAEAGVELAEYSLFDKCRMVVEFLLFGWAMKGKRRRKGKGGQN
ncbi:MAG: DUF2007 domain-containing protein [Desulfuromonadales bacterium]|nr:DUF2007 domain-containing protein [Desulfuromonadales bacterium]